MHYIVTQFKIKYRVSHIKYYFKYTLKFIKAFSSLECIVILLYLKNLDFSFLDIDTVMNLSTIAWEGAEENSRMQLSEPHLSTVAIILGAQLSCYCYLSICGSGNKC